MSFRWDLNKTQKACIKFSFLRLIRPNKSEKLSAGLHYERVLGEKYI